MVACFSPGLISLRLPDEMTNSSSVIQPSWRPARLFTNIEVLLNLHLSACFYKCDRPPHQWARHTMSHTKHHVTCPLTSPCNGLYWSTQHKSIHRLYKLKEFKQINILKSNRKIDAPTNPAKVRPQLQKQNTIYSFMWYNSTNQRKHNNQV